MPSIQRQQSIQSSHRPSIDSPGLPGATPVPARSPAAPLTAVQQSPVAVPPVAYQQPQVPPAQMYQPALQRRASGFAPHTPNAPFQTPGMPHPYAAAQPSPYTPYQTNRMQVPPASMYNPNAPRPIEVFHLSDAANAAIPADIREQFHCDDYGHVLFFSSPPLDITPSVQQKLGHSLKYLAAKEERRKLVEAQKRKEREEQEEREKSAKRQRADEETALAARVEALTSKAVDVMTNQVMKGTDTIYEILYHDNAPKAKEADAKAREQRLLAEKAARRITAQIQAQSEKASFVSLKGSALYMDEVDNGP